MMLSGLIEWSLANRALVIAMFVLMSLGGLYATTQVPVDAVPDLVNTQVQIVTEAGTLPPLEVERSRDTTVDRRRDALRGPNSAPLSDAEFYTPAGVVAVGPGKLTAAAVKT